MNPFNSNSPAILWAPLVTGTPVAINSTTEAPVAGDMSPDGMEILMKTYNNMLYWRRRPFVSLVETLQEPPTCLTYNIEPQGEAVCFDRRGEGFYTISEGVGQPLWYYDRVERQIV